MSTAFFPTNMRSMPSGGMNHRSTYENTPYVTWKGTGVFSNPTAIASTHIRPLTNNDPGNVFQTGFGLPRPLKQYRKGRVVPVKILVENPENPNEYIVSESITYNTNRNVVSSTGISLGGGNGGRGLISETQDAPGNVIVKQNQVNEINQTIQLNKDCKKCEGVGMVASYYPTTTYLTENPEKNTQNQVLCCNAQKKALKRVLPASTILKQNYYTTTKQYLQNRCQTFKQREFNFQTPNNTNILEQQSDNPFVTPSAINNAKAGSPLALLNTYVANCQPNAEIYDSTENAFIMQMLTIMQTQNILTEKEVQIILSSNIDSIQSFFNFLNALPPPTNNLALTVFVDYINNPYWGMPPAGPSNPNGCKLVVYKPNNYQYAKQGAVESSAKILKLKVDTITTNAASFNNYNANENPTAPQLTNGIKPPTPFVLKYKVPVCDPVLICPFQNKKACSYQSLPIYRVPISQPSPYRYFRGTVFSSNHYNTSATTYLYNTSSK